MDIFSGSCSTFLFDFLRPGVEIGMNPRDGIFSKKTQTVHFKFQSGRFC